MWHRYWRAIAALTFIMAWAQTAQPSSASTAKQIVFEGVVKRIESKDPAQPVRVTFTKFAAIYVLNRSAPEFSTWVSRLETSKKTGTPVLFTYEDYGPRLTSVELAKP